MSSTLEDIFPLPPIEVGPRDLSAYRVGNTGVDYVHRIESGRPGPHVLVCGLTHGNEFCGAQAVTDLLDHDVRPRIGTLTVCLANVEAYETFDPAQPFKSRQLEHNLNRIWSPSWLDGPDDSPELRRARALRPVLDAADHVLDLHSTQNDVDPFWLYAQFSRNQAAATAIGAPRRHVMLPPGMGLGAGTPLTQHGAHGRLDGQGVSLIAECGQHFLQATTLRAIDITRRFLAHFGLIDHSQPPPPAPQPLVLTYGHVIRSPDFRLVRPLAGFEVFAQGELIATDGEDELRAPYDDCTILMPARYVIVGREGFYLTRPL